MCGIYGYLGPAGRAVPEALKLVDPGILGRGEVAGILEDDGAFLHVSRLPLVDRGRAAQPFVSNCGRYAILFNGEIFNFRELRAALAGRYEFRTESDTETALAAFLERGEACLPEFRGQFAFVVYDRRERSWFAARDRLGICPLYYVEDGEGAAFSSTISGLLPRRGTIRRLEPGCLKNSGSEPRRWYAPAAAEKDWTEPGLFAALRKGLEDSVRLRVDTGLPVAVVYSGGLDSSIVLSLAAKLHPDVTAFTIGEEDSEDVRTARRFCLERGIRHVVVPFGAEDVSGAAIGEAISHCELDEYLDIINAVITVRLFRAIRERGIRIALCGDGSDELFGGYDMYRRADGPALRELFLHKLGTLGNTELQRVDRAAMSNGVEARVPFLDDAVVEIALGLPPVMKNRDGIEKWCLRRAFADELPDYVIARRKNPLSHSSGLHERIRMRMITFARHYRRAGLNRFAPIREDFSHALRRAHHDVRRAIALHARSSDYSLWHKLAEFGKAFLRRTILR